MKANLFIKQYLEEKGIKPSFVSDRAGISPELFMRSLNGKRKIPADEFISICNVLSLNISDFKQYLA